MARTYHGSILMISLHGYVSAEPELGKPDTGGQVVFVLELAKRFSRLGYKVDVLTRRFENQPTQDRINRGLRVWRIPFGGKKFIRKEEMHDHVGDFITNFLAEATKRKQRYDVVNSHYWDAGWAGQRIAEEMQIPHIHTPHSLGAWKEREMRETSTSAKEKKEMENHYRFEERIRKEFLIYRNCDHLIPTTHEQEQFMQEHYDVPRDHMTVIPPGIDEGKYTPVEPERLRRIREELKMRPTDVYTVGRAATNKGIDLMIRALPELRKLQPKARLRMAVGANSAGDRRQVEKWKQLAEELGVSRQIKWLAYIPDDKMADYYRAGGVFALPSRYEPFGMTAVEAMACGTPTVVTVHGGLRDSVEYGKHALFADPLRPAEFAGAINMLMQYPELRERLSVEGARFARRQFGWTGIAKRTLAVFDQYKGRYEDLQAEAVV